MRRKADFRRLGNLAPCWIARIFLCSANYSGAASGPSAHLTAAVFIGSIRSHFKQRSSVRPVSSVTAIKRLLHRAQRVVSYAQASADLGVHPTQLRNWLKQLADDPQNAFPGQGQMKPGAIGDRAAQARGR
jgi:hypothetical protein